MRRQGLRRALDAPSRRACDIPRALQAGRAQRGEAPHGAHAGRGGAHYQPRLARAGIPRVMQAMFDGVKHQLVGGKPVLSRTVSCHLAEGVIAKGLGELQARYPDLDIGSYPFYRRGEFGTSLVLRGREMVELAAATSDVIELIRALGGTPVEE